MHFVAIPDFPNYEVSPEGIIRNAKTGHILKPNYSNQGYGMVWLSGQNVMVHKIVAQVFVSGYLQGAWITHLNGNRQDNRACNLKWG